MKKFFLPLLLTGLFFSASQLKAGAQFKLSNLTDKEAGQGIKEALEQGLVKAVLQLNKEDGFYKDALYRILLPPEAQKIEKTLRNAGMGKTIDKAILQINRAAEDAAASAKPIFLEALRNMTLTDAIGLLKNTDTSATHFFRTKTDQKLFEAFLPIIKASLDKTDATKYYADMVNSYNKIPTTFKKLNPDLPGFVTQKATLAMFDLVSKEEINIRHNISARPTDLLKKVFGSK